MSETSNGGQQSAFSRWLRTGRLPTVPGLDGIELKFNPWHDPANGRFTFAGLGRYHGAGGAKPRDRVPRPADNLRRPRVATGPKAETPRAGHATGFGKRAEGRRPAGVPPKPIAAARPGDQLNRATEFVGGVGEGLYGVAKETVAAVHSTLTTNPATTLRNAGRGIAGMIDTAIAAEDTPAAVQVSRAADAVANASARDIGRATGSVVGNTALAVAPGAALGKVSALRRLRRAGPRPAYDPPQIGWVKEKLKPGEPWTDYNNAAPGSRPDQAPTLMRTMPDGSKRPVKFDGVQGEYVIDRKWGIRDAARARAQLMRQSEVLAQHRLIGIWEVPNQTQKMKALKMLKRMNVTNIKVRVVKP